MASVPRLGRSEPAIANTLSAFATRANAVAEDGKGANSPYTAALLKHLVAPDLDLRMGWAESPTVFLGRAWEMANRALGLNDAELRARIVLGRVLLRLTLRLAPAVRMHGYSAPPLHF